MDSLISAAARALAMGDVLGALGRVALRDDPPALALRGIAMAQLAPLGGARAALDGAAAHGIHDDLVTPRCAAGYVELPPRRRSAARNTRSTA